MSENQAAAEPKVVKILSASEILNAQDLPRKYVEVPQWGGGVYVRTLTGAEKDEYDQSLFVPDADGKIKRDPSNFRAKLCSLCMVDENGKRLFSFEEARALGAKSAAALTAIYEAAQELNGMGKEARDAARKNLKNGQSEDSPSV